MIFVEVNNGAFKLEYDISEISTVEDIVKKFQDDNGFRFANTPTVFDPSNNRQCAYSEDVKDGNVYAMTCWIIQKVDERGNPVTKQVFT